MIEQKPTPPHQVLSASDLVDRARRFSDLVARYRRPLMQYFRRRGVDPTEAEDLTQDVFLRLMRKLSAEAAVMSDGYVFSAASSVLIDHYRSRHVRGVGVELDPETHDPAPGAEKILEDREALRVMLSTLLGLNDKLRRAFILHRFEQLSHVEIASRLKVSVSTVEKYVMKALDQLRTAVDRRVDD